MIKLSEFSAEDVNLIRPAYRRVIRISLSLSLSLSFSLSLSLSLSLSSLPNLFHHLLIFFSSGGVRFNLRSIDAKENLGNVLRSLVLSLRADGQCLRTT